MQTTFQVNTTNTNSFDEGQFINLVGKITESHKFEQQLVIHLIQGQYKAKGRLFIRIDMGQSEHVYELSNKEQFEACKKVEYEDCNILYNELLYACGWAAHTNMRFKNRNPHLFGVTG